MSRGMYKLRDRAIKAKSLPGRYADGGGLYLQVQPGGSKSFVFMKTLAGKRQVLGLGSYPHVSLAAARERSSQLRTEIEAGELAGAFSSEFSLKEAKQLLAAKTAEEKTVILMTFERFAKEWMDKNLINLSNDKHRQQWYASLRDYAKPIAKKPLSDITTHDILACLQPIWQAKPETPRRVQQRIERTLAAADMLGYRDGKNPAQWKNNLDLILPNMRKLKKHHAAMPHSALPEFVKVLQARNSIAAYALQFIILTASRSGEGRGARWSEMDFDRNVWTIPAERMKARKEQRVPLSKACLAILAELEQQAETDFVFAPPGRSNHVSEAAIRKLMAGKGSSAYTIHGFRSSFRDWAGNATSFPRELAEEALAHQLGAVEAAYRRDQAVERRRTMMEA